MIRTQDHGDILELRLDHPPANALTPELIVELASTVRNAPEAGARALVLSGAPGMFSAGLDVPAFLELDRETVGQAWRDFFALMAALAGSSVPIVAALTGHAPAGGCVLALCCDWRIMATGRFKIGLNEVQVGVRVPGPILAAARSVVGARQAARMCTTAVLMDGVEAMRIGLVDEIVPEGDVVPAAIAWAEQQISLPQDTLRRTRELVRRDFMQTFERMDDTELEWFLDEWFGEETQAALQALVERLAAKKV